MKWSDEFTLSEYQKRSVIATLTEWAKTGPQKLRKVLICAATGAGKTIICCRVMFLAVGRGKKCLFLADSEELVSQTVRKLFSTCGIIADVEQQDRWASLESDVVVASIQSLSRHDRLARFPKDHFNVVIADEAHLSLAPSWMRALKHFEGSDILGVTATPSRGDRQCLLKKFWDKIVANIPMFDLIDQGALVPVRVDQFPIDMDLEGVELAMEEEQTSLAEAMQPLHDTIISGSSCRQPSPPTLWFHPSRASSRAFTERLISRGHSAMHIDGESKDRKEILMKFAQNRFRNINNAMLLVKGYDQPDISCIVPLRAFRTKTPFIQAIGRGTRLYCPNGCRDYRTCDHEGKKKDLLVLDIFGSYPDLGIMSMADIAGDDPEQIKAMRRAILEKDGPIDIKDLSVIVAGEREQSFVQNLKKARKWNKKVVYDARDVAAAIGNHKLFDFDAGSVSRYERGRVTSGQEVNLANMGIDPKSVKNSGHAVAILDEMFRWRRSGAATIEQISMMLKKGMSFEQGITYKQAQEKLSS